MRVRAIAASLLAPALLAAVASVQWWRVATHDQSPWSGVGMGMFATFEGEKNRRVRAEVELDGTLLAAQIPAALLARADGLRTVPSAAATERLASDLAREGWVARGDRAVAAADGASARRVVVVVEGVELRGTTDHPALTLIEVRRVEVGPSR